MDIKKILEDLYRLDPALRSEEVELKKIIKKFAEQKPEAEYDEDFKERLRSELLKRLAEKKKEDKTRAGFFIIHRKAVVSAAGIAAAVIVALSFAVRPGFLADVMNPDRMTASEQAYEEPYRDESVDLFAKTDEKAVSPGKEAHNEALSQTVPAENKKSEKPQAPPDSVIVSASERRDAAPSVSAAAPVMPEADDLFFDVASSAKMEYDSEELEMPLNDETEGVFGGEEYKPITENDFIRTFDEPLSTFSIDVDTASYSNTRRFINSGFLPDPDAVRIEELINYFDYDYPQPSDNTPFSFTTELSVCPWNREHRLLHIGLQGYNVSREELPRTNIVFLIDSSGSMQDENKLPLLKDSLSLLIDNLRQEDRVSIVAYAGSAGLVLPPTAGTRKAEILGALDKLEAGGSTAGGEGIDLAYKTAARNLFPDGNNRVILATDGDFNVGQSSEEELKNMIEERRDQGIFLTVLGLGMGNYKDARMEALADNGNGNYAYIDTLNEANKVLVTELSSTLLTIAKDVKIQIDFNSDAVDSYRLVGYENRVMASEDFDDDKKDAGEIGAGHSITVLYEIIPATNDSSDLADIKFRYKRPDEEQSILVKTIIENRPEPLSEASNNFLFSSAVAEWGMILRGSEYIPEADIDDVIIRAAGAKGDDRYGYREEFIELLNRTKELMY